jgi:hypothetical protein
MPWRRRAPAILFAVAVLALGAATAAWFLFPNWKHAPAPQPPAASPSPSTSIAPPPAPPTPTANPDDRYAAMAVSPSPRNGGKGGYGWSTTQDRAAQIALNACKANTGDDLCNVIIISGNHGCVAYVIDDNGASAGGAGDTEDAARKTQGSTIRKGSLANT